MILTDKDRELLHDGLVRLGLPAGSPQIDRYQCYIRELQLWTRRVRLISGGPQDIIVRHLLDSLAPWQLLRRQMQRVTEPLSDGGSDGGDAGGVLEIADVGSGNGFPALVLAGLVKDELLPPARFYLVERGAKKAAFLRSTAGLLGLYELLHVEERDVRQMQRQVQVVVSRAFMPMGDAYRRLRPLLGRGVMIFYAGRRDTIESQLAHIRPQPQYVIEPVEVPFLDEERHLCCLHMS